MHSACATMSMPHLLDVHEPWCSCHRADGAPCRRPAYHLLLVVVDYCCHSKQRRRTVGLVGLGDGLPCGPSRTSIFRRALSASSMSVHYKKGLLVTRVASRSPFALLVTRVASSAFALLPVALLPVALLPVALLSVALLPVALLPVALPWWCEMGYWHFEVSNCTNHGQ